MRRNVITYKRLDQYDIPNLKELIKIYNEVFETERFPIPDLEYLQSLLDNQNIIFCVACLDNIVIGGLTAHILASVYHAVSEVYIYDLAVKHEMQRQGTGTELITFLKKYCIESGYKQMYVQANADDQHAIDFYKARGGHSEKVFHFSYNLTNTE